MEMPLIGHREISRENLAVGYETLHKGSVSHRFLLENFTGKGIPNTQCC